MKFHHFFVSLFTLSAIIMVDYILVVVIGITANQFGATNSFYELIYPYIIGTIILSSIVVPIFVVLHKHSAKQKENNVMHSITTHSSIYIKQTA